MRYIIDLEYGSGDGVEGIVTPESGDATAFSGWLELLRLLEGPEVGTPPASRSETGEQISR